jgi:Fe-S cluster assembly iron-binding protein IscA
MVTVTERAASELRTQLLALTSDPEIGLRLLPAIGGRFMLILDTEQSGDQVVEHQGSKVLLIGIEYLRALEGFTIECYDTQEGPVLFVKQQ